MTTSILNSVLSLRSETLQALSDYFTSIQCDVFSPIINMEVKDDTEKMQTISFIACAYSEDSPMVIIRRDAKEEKAVICEFLQIPEYIQNTLITLSDPVVRSCAINYIETFSGEEYRHLMFMKIQHEDLERDITNRKFTVESGKENIEYRFDHKEYGKAVAEKGRLAKEIVKLEKSIRENYKYLEIEKLKNYKEKKKEVFKNSRRTGSMEGSEYIK